MYSDRPMRPAADPGPDRNHSFTFVKVNYRSKVLKGRETGGGQTKKEKLTMDMRNAELVGAPFTPGASRLLYFGVPRTERTG